MSNFLAKWKLSCKKATELIEKNQIVPLQFSERFRLNLHKKMCAACNAYEKQSLLLDKALNKPLAAGQEEIMSSEGKERILNELKKNRPD